MAENVTLGSFSTLQNSSIIATLNSNNTILTTALADCMSLSGTQPNQMLANLDMNSQQIINLPAPGTLNSPVRLVDLQNATIGSFGASIYGLLAGNNTWTGSNTFSSSVTLNGTNVFGGIATFTNSVSVSGSTGLLINTATGSLLNATSSNTGADNFLKLSNSSNSPATANTAASIYAFLSNLTNGYIRMAAIGGATKYGYLISGADLAGGMQIVSNAGTILINPTTTLQLQSNGAAIGDYGLSTASTWTFSGTGGVVVNTSTGTMLNIASTNTGGANSIFISNAGTVSNSSTIARILLNLSAGANAFAAFYLQGGANPIWILNSSTGITGGISLSSSAGPVVVGASTTLQFLSNGSGIADYGLTTASVWTFNSVLTATGGLKTGLNSALVTSTVSMNNGAGASTGTLTNAPAATNPTKWIPINDNGTTRYIPAW